MTLVLADPNVTECPPVPEGPCPLCGSRQYWWRPGFTVWVCGGCALPADKRLGLEWVEVAWSDADWADWAKENPQTISDAIELARTNFVRHAMYDPLRIVEKARALMKGSHASERTPIGGSGHARH